MAVEEGKGKRRKGIKKKKEMPSERPARHCAWGMAAAPAATMRPLLLILPLAFAANPWHPTSTTAFPIAVTESGASGRQWATLPSQSWTPGTQPAHPALALDRTTLRQEVLGFGSCFTDTSAYNALVYATPDMLDQLLEAVWGESGLRSSVMRMHINSPDYAVHSYNFDNVTEDFALLHFDSSLAYDRQRVIPLIKLAQAKAASWTTHGIKLFGSPWSPPGWMKNNDNMINSDAVCLKNDTAAGDSYAAVWARYILKWLQAYEAQNITLWGLTPQNEPEARQGRFESCAYDVPHYVDFVGAHLGPTVLPSYPALNIMAYDHNKLDSIKFAQGIEGNTASAAAVTGTAIHWYDYYSSLGLEQLDAIHALAPSKFLLSTEACFLDALEFDFENTGFLYAVDIIADLNHWVSGWVAWNTVLLSGTMYPESRGGPNHDNTTHFGDGILLEYNASGTQRLVLQSSYWVRGGGGGGAPARAQQNPTRHLCLLFLTPFSPPTLNADSRPLFSLCAPRLCHCAHLWLHRPEQ